MQLFAIDDKDQIINVLNSKKQQDYTCLECGSTVRKRGGFIKQLHFYHLDTERKCRQNGKSQEHLQLQLYFKNLYPDCQLEKPFSEIGRIADICLEKYKIIIEIQCSPIGAKEIYNRNRDYAKFGYQVIWIFHDQHYNKNRLSSAEYFLQDSPHYFTNMDEEGKGIIYDQWDYIVRGYRVATLHIKEVTILQDVSKKLSQDRTMYLPVWMRKRAILWSSLFAGDFIDHINQLDQESFIDFKNGAESIIKQPEEMLKISFTDKVKGWFSLPYKLSVNWMMEAVSRS